MTNSTSSSPWPKLRPTSPAPTRSGRRARRCSAASTTISVPGVARVPVAILEQARAGCSSSRRSRRRSARPSAAGAAGERLRVGARSSSTALTLFSSTPVSRRSCCAHRVVRPADRRRRRSPAAARRETRPRARAGACRVAGSPSGQLRRAYASTPREARRSRSSRERCAAASTCAHGPAVDRRRAAAAATSRRRRGLGAGAVDGHDGDRHARQTRRRRSPAAAR